MKLNSARLKPALHAGLGIVRPYTLRYAGRTARLGPIQTVFLTLILSGSGAVRFSTVKRKLWGDPLASDARLREAVHRLNAKLAEVGCPAVAVTDRGKVYLR